MNPSGAIILIVALLVAYFALSGSDFFMNGFGTGPIATGPGRGSEIQNPQPISTGNGSSGASSASQDQKAAQPPPGISPYKDKVRIRSVDRSNLKPEQEYVVISYGGGFFGFSGGESRQSQPIDVTGWTIGNARATERIPQAFNIPEIDATERDIFLPAGGDLVIVTGTPPYQQNFRENACVGYFNQTHAFTPSLSNSCADSDASRSVLIGFGFNGACIDAIDSIPACRTPQGPFAIANIKSECVNYMNENFSYVGCVKNFRDSKDFLKNTWRVSLRRNEKLFDPRHDRVILRDRAGLLVDEFEY